MSDIQNISFFVYLVESPSAPDIYHKRSEGDLIASSCGLHNTPCVVRCAISREALEASFSIGLVEEMKDRPGAFPVIHISAHGNTDGIRLSNGDHLSWDDLRDILTPINEALDGGLVICMSCCEGYSSVIMAMEDNPDVPLPFFAVVSAHGSPEWSDTSVAFSTFYHLLSRGKSIPDAVEAMNVATGTDLFVFSTAEDSRQGYIDYLTTVDVDDALTEIDDFIEHKPKDRMMKMRDAIS